MDTTNSAADALFSSLLTPQIQRATLANNALQTGITYYSAKKYDRAASEFKRAISMDPSSTTAYNFLANAYISQNKTTDAIKTYQNSLKLDSSQDDIHVKLANLFMTANRNAEAEKEFKAAYKENPASTIAHYTLGLLYNQTGRYKEAETELKTVIKMAPNDANAYYGLGLTYNSQGKTEDAITQLKKSVSLNSKLAAAQYELGVAYSAIGQDDKAQEQVNILTNLKSNLTTNLKVMISKPSIVSANGTDAQNSSFLSFLGPNTPIYTMDPSLIEPNSSKPVTMVFQFDQKMDGTSVQDLSNWTISRASGGRAGYYNNSMPVNPDTDAKVASSPLSVVYNAVDMTATVSFLLNQNANSTATIDPSHLVFKFAGKNIYGQKMSSKADEYDGAALSSF